MMDTEMMAVMAKLQSYVDTLDVERLQEAAYSSCGVECLGLLPDEEDENLYAELYEGIC